MREKILDRSHPNYEKAKNYILGLKGSDGQSSEPREETLDVSLNSTSMAGSSNSSVVLVSPDTKLKLAGAFHPSPGIGGGVMHRAPLPSSSSSTSTSLTSSAAAASIVPASNDNSNSFSSNFNNISSGLLSLPSPSSNLTSSASRNSSLSTSSSNSLSVVEMSENRIEAARKESEVIKSVERQKGDASTLSASFPLPYQLAILRDKNKRKHENDEDDKGNDKPVRRLFKG